MLLGDLIPKIKNPRIVTVSMNLCPPNNSLYYLASGNKRTFNYNKDMQLQFSTSSVSQFFRDKVKEYLTTHISNIFVEFLYRRYMANPTSTKSINAFDNFLKKDINSLRIDDFMGRVGESSSYIYYTKLSDYDCQDRIITFMYQFTGKNINVVQHIIKNHDQIKGYIMGHIEAYCETGEHSFLSKVAEILYQQNVTYPPIKREDLISFFKDRKDIYCLFKFAKIGERMPLFEVFDDEIGELPFYITS